MIEAIFGVIIVALIICFVLYVKETNKEKAKLINALIARTPKEAAELTMADKLQIQQSSNPSKPPDLVPLEDVSQEDFEAHIKKTLS